jgi:hypothetical protein
VSRPAIVPTQPPAEWVPGFFQGVKRPGHEADHSPLPSAEVKNGWRYTSTTSYVFKAWTWTLHTLIVTMQYVQASWYIHRYSCHYKLEEQVVPQLTYPCLKGCSSLQRLRLCHRLDHNTRLCTDLSPCPSLVLSVLRACSPPPPGIPSFWNIVW